MFDTGVLPVRVLAGVLERGVLRNTGGDSFEYLFLNSVRIIPHCITEKIVEFLDDVGQVIHLGLGAGTASSGWYGSDLGILIGKDDLLHGFLLDPVAFQIDGFK